MPRISQVLPWLDAHGVAIVSALAAIVAAWKLVPAQTRARIELAFPRVAGVVRSVAAVAPDLVGFARVVWYQVAQGKARGGSVPAAVPPSPIEPRRGFAAVDALAVAGLAAMLAFTAAALAGCPLPAPDGCQPLATRCSPSGVPQSCSPTQRWTSGALQNPCSQRALGAVCCRTRSPYGNELFACAPQSACLPDPAGPTSTPATLAATQ